MALHGEKQPDGSFIIYTQDEWEQKNKPPEGPGLGWLLVPAAAVVAFPFLYQGAQPRLRSEPPTPSRLGSVVFSSPCRVRAQPRLDAPIIGHAGTQRPYDVLSARGRWLEIRSVAADSALSGWAGCVDRATRRGSFPATTSARTSGPLLRVRFPAGCRVRTGPSLGAEVVGRVRPGVSYSVTSRNGRWARVRGDTSEGWSVGWTGCEDRVLARAAAR
ncbi:MAG: SH3 domain-containing protein [Myxococcota bacterium]